MTWLYNLSHLITSHLRLLPLSYNNHRNIISINLSCDEDKSLSIDCDDDLAIGHLLAMTRSHLIISLLRSRINWMYCQNIRCMKMKYIAIVKSWEYVYSACWIKYSVQLICYAVKYDNNLSDNVLIDAHRFVIQQNTITTPYLTKCAQTKITQVVIQRKPCLRINQEHKYWYL